MKLLKIKKWQFILIILVIFYLSSQFKDIDKEGRDNLSTETKVNQKNIVRGSNIKISNSDDIKNTIQDIPNISQQLKDRKTEMVSQIAAVRMQTKVSKILSNKSETLALCKSNVTAMITIDSNHYTLVFNNKQIPDSILNSLMFLHKKDELKLTFYRPDDKIIQFFQLEKYNDLFKSGRQLSAKMIITNIDNGLDMSNSIVVASNSNDIQQSTNICDHINNVIAKYSIQDSNGQTIITDASMPIIQNSLLEYLYMISNHHGVSAIVLHNMIPKPTPNTNGHVVINVNFI